jgi:hypothetical protein
MQDDFPSGLAVHKLLSGTSPKASEHSKLVITGTSTKRRLSLISEASSDVLPQPETVAVVPSYKLLLDLEGKSITLMYLSKIYKKNKNLKFGDSIGMHAICYVILSDKN